MFTWKDRHIEWKERERNTCMSPQKKTRTFTCLYGKKQFHLYMERDGNIYIERVRGTLTRLHGKRQEHLHVYTKRERGIYMFTWME